eukprot:COSAG05_NODE_3702_length_1895_cov_3.036748_3_plen_58_part_00
MLPALTGNWVFNQHTSSSGALYPDEGSAYSSWHSNVVTDIGTDRPTDRPTDRFNSEK